MNAFSHQFIAALRARNAEVFSADTVTAINNAQRSAVALDRVMSLPAFAEVAPGLIRRARAAQPTDKLNYVAVKVLVKIISTVQAIATKWYRDLDPYTATIGKNLISLNQMSNKSNLVCLCKSIEYSALDAIQALRAHRDCSPGTASTQSSSTRMCLNYLGVCDVRKAKTGDVMKLCDNERAKLFVSIFAPATTSADDAHDADSDDKGSQSSADEPVTQPDALTLADHPASADDDDTAEVQALIDSMVDETLQQEVSEEHAQLCNEQLSDSAAQVEPIDNSDPVQPIGDEQPSAEQPSEAQPKSIKRNKGKRSSK